jgi:toxin ParE1/3/4
MVKIFWTDESIKWLREIHDYIARDNENIASHVISEIIEKVEKLTDFPSMGQKLSDWPNENIRMILYGHYRIVYSVVSDDRLDILGIYHGSLDLQKHLKR